MSGLLDSFGRRFSYLRLSITDECNFRCGYCLPNGYQNSGSGLEEFLSLDEIRNLARAFAEMGTWKVRITGGEPTLRRDLLDIVRVIKETPGIRWVALSTNGTRLSQLVSPLLEAGVDAINLSVDSLDRQRFHEITGRDRLDEILGGIDLALRSGFKQVKLNAVLMKDWNADELNTFTAWIQDRPVAVRFIELMPTGTTSEFFKKHHMKADDIQRTLLTQGWRRDDRKEGDGPAVEFSHSAYRGKIGIIAPYSSDFCTTCNRLRVTSQGGLRLCLFGEGNHSIRYLLKSPSQREELKETLISLLQKKEISHYLPQGNYGNNQTFSAMGG